MLRVLVILAPLALSGCAAAAIGGAVVGTTAKVGAFAVKTTAKTAWGAGKLAYRGTKAGVNLARGKRTDGSPRGYEGDGRGPDVTCPPDRC